MSDPLYKRSLLRLAADAHGAGRIEGAHRHGHAHNPACGDKIEVDIALDGERIARMAHETKACVLSQASASILAQHAKGLTPAEIETLRRGVAAMLTRTGPVPDSPFEAYGEFEGAADFAGRHRCVLLPFDALLDALNSSEADEV